MTLPENLSPKSTARGTSDNLRVALRAARRSVVGSHRSAAEVAICDAVEERLPNEPSIIASYLAIDGEVDLSRLHDNILNSNHQLVVPAIQTDAQQLTFHRLHDDSMLTSAAHGTKEPVNRGEVVAISDISMMLLPCVGIDDFGTRMGFGAGFYDRTLGPLIGQQSALPQLIAIAFEVQVKPQLERHAWDVPVEVVVTERGWRAAGRQGSVT